MATNVVVVTVDCFRYDRCGFAGHDRNTTPFLDGLADSALVFDRAYATGPYTPESFPGILAGRHGYNSTYVSDLVLKSIPDGAATLATEFESAGYETTAVVTNPHLTRERNFDRGFERYVNLRVGEDGGYEEENDEHGVSARVTSALTSMLGSFQSGIERTDRPTFSPFVVPFVGYRHYQHLFNWPTIDGCEVTNGALTEIERADDPFFLWTHFMDLHGPLRPRTVRAGGLSTGPTRQFVWDARRLANVDAPHHERRYDAVLRYVDEQIRTLVEVLQDCGAWEDTILVVTGDHGEALNDRGLYGHPRHYPYDELLHVPLLVRDPNREGRRVDAPFSLGWLHELLADCLEFNRFDLPASSPRESHVDPDRTDVTLLADSISDKGHTVVTRDGEYKYVRHEGERLGYIESEVAFDTLFDVAERSPLDPERVPDTLRAAADEVVTEPETVVQQGRAPGDDVRSRLRELGYI